MKESTKDKIEIQIKYCDMKDLPMFLPSDGRCYWCHEDITEKYTEKRCGETLITRCPHCSRSLND